MVVIMYLHKWRYSMFGSRLTIVFIVAFITGCGGDGTNNNGWVEIIEPTSNDTYELHEYKELIEIRGNSFGIAATVEQQCYCPDITFLTCLFFGFWICGDEYTVEHTTPINIENMTMNATGITMSHGPSWSGASLVQTGENIIQVTANDGSGNYGIDALKVTTRYDSSGLPRWIRILGSDRTDTGTGLAIDTDSNSYVVGNSTGYDVPSYAFYAKYNESGDQLWMRQNPETPDSRMTYKDIAVDAHGNGYIAAQKSSIHAPFIYHAVLSKHDLSGNHVWSKELSGNTYIDSDALDIDSHGNIYVTGVSNDDMDADGSVHIFVAKYDPDGNLIWIYRLRASDGNTTRANSNDSDIAVDHEGNSYITATTNGNFVCPIAQGNDVTIAKLDTDGNLLWIKQFCLSVYYYSTAIAVDGLGNSYITGYKVYPTDAWTPDNRDTFIAKYDPQGNQEWLNTFSITSVDIAKDIAVNANGISYIAGWTYPDFGVRTLGVEYPDDDDALYITSFDTDGQQISLKQFYVPNRSSFSINRIAINDTGRYTVMSSLYTTTNRNDVYISHFAP